MNTLSQSFLLISPSAQQRQEYIVDFCKQKGIGKSDQITIVPEENSLGIAQVRLAQKNAFFAPLQSKEKAIIFEKAHLLTLDAQNALLKLLEEPPLHTYMFLSAKSVQSFLPTIVSRCTVKQFEQPQKEITEDSKQELKQDFDFLQTGSVGEKLFLAEKLANKKDELATWLDTFILFLRDIMLINPDKPEVVSLLRHVQKARYLIQTTNVAPRIILEHCFLARAS